MSSPEISSHESFASGGQLAFLRRIADDDEFRAELEAHPRAAFAEYGIRVDSESLPGHVVLPSKDLVLKNLGHLAAGDEEMRPPWFGLIG